MKTPNYPDRLIADGSFRFFDLKINEIDNAPVLKINQTEMAQEETCLFHRDVSSGDQYFQILHNFLSERLSHRNSAPIVRFADGEYSFYARDLHCNGLYQQAESVKAIQKALPEHIDALRVLSQIGKMAPLIYPGNTQEKNQGLLSFFHRRKNDESAVRFLEFLYENDIAFTKDNYVPFLVVYAYLTSREFAMLVDQRKLCLIGAECDIHLCRKWFGRSFSRPEIIFTQIPERYVATQWKSLRKSIMNKIPSDIDICLVGAGIGSLLICVDIANRFSVPAIDAGHVMNMMNGREDKSNGPRLYTMRKKSCDWIEE